MDFWSVVFVNFGCVVFFEVRPHSPGVQHHAAWGASLVVESGAGDVGGFMLLRCVVRVFGDIIGSVTKHDDNNRNNGQKHKVGVDLHCIRVAFAKTGLLVDVFNLFSRENVGPFWRKRRSLGRGL